MSPGLFIRVHVFGVAAQPEWATLLRCSQASVSRFDNGTPLSRKAQTRIRELAAERDVTWRGRPWTDSWLFEAPPEVRAMVEEGIAA